MLWWVADERDLYSLVRYGTGARKKQPPYPFSRVMQPTFERATDSEAPSWSWACIRGPITYATVVDADPPYLRIPASGDSSEVDIHFVTGEVDRPGKTKGTVKLTGSLLKATALIDYWKISSLKVEAFCSPCHEHTVPTQHGVPDATWWPDTKPPLEGELFCLLLRNESEQWSICIVPTGVKPNEYRRVGVVKWPKYLYDGFSSRGTQFVDVAAEDRRRNYKPKEDYGRLHMYPESWVETLSIV